MDCAGVVTVIDDSPPAPPAPPYPVPPDQLEVIYISDSDAERRRQGRGRGRGRGGRGQTGSRHRFGGWRGYGVSMVAREIIVQRSFSQYLACRVSCSS